MKKRVLALFCALVLCFSSAVSLTGCSSAPEYVQIERRFRELVVKTKELIEEYQKQYGPLTAFASAMDDSFDWLNSPWPWERECDC